MRPLPSGEQRTWQQIREHYDVEHGLALRLATAPSAERSHLYAEVYDELFRRLPHHPQLARKASPEETQREIDHQLGLLRPLLNQDMTFVEVGAGDCALAFAVAALVRRVYAVDVSAEITKGLALPDNVELILADGQEIPLAPNSVDMVYSNQLMEHLHPEDAYGHLHAIHRVLAPGGAYVCVTPNSLNGPWDISRPFTSTATGFHLHEYTMTELSAFFARVGFSPVHAFVPIPGGCIRLPSLAPARWYEGLLARLPDSLRRTVALWTLPVNIRLVGVKSSGAQRVQAGSAR